MPDEELRSIFQRINRNNVTLNAQELRHATYWGSFISLMEEIANFEFWSSAGIFSANDTRRMLDVEFISELAVALLNGFQNKKKNLEDYYQQYEMAFDDAGRVKNIFMKVLGELEQVIPELQKSRWRKKSDFYTLFLCLTDHATLLPLSSEKRAELGRLLQEFATTVDAIISGETAPNDDFAAYVKHVERAASDLGSRKARHNALSKHLQPVFPTSI
ncbi:MAG: DUF262 domain-containing protein [Planctomycetota bacterium]|nr:DUF262 domain-containing protein [Planctomycetota bacterium]